MHLKKPITNGEDQQNGQRLLLQLRIWLQSFSVMTTNLNRLSWKTTFIEQHYTWPYEKFKAEIARNRPCLTTKKNVLSSEQYASFYISDYHGEHLRIKITTSRSVKSRFLGPSLSLITTLQRKYYEAIMELNPKCVRNISVFLDRGLVKKLWYTRTKRIVWNKFYFTLD